MTAAGDGAAKDGAACTDRGRRAALAALAGGVGLLALGGCQALYQTHGYVPTDAELARIKVGVDTRDTVGATLGPPSIEGLLNDVGWYYVETRWKTQGIAAPKAIDRQVVAITFDKKGVVSNVERWGLAKGEIVPLSRRVTSAPVKGKSFLQQLFGNIGGISASQFVSPY